MASKVNLVGSCLGLRVGQLRSSAGGIVDPLREVRALKRWVQVGVYGAIVGTEPFYYFVLHYSWPQLLSGLIVGLLIAFSAIEWAFNQMFKLRKRSAYPNVLLQQLSGASGVDAAVEQALPVITSLLNLRAAFVLVREENGDLRLVAAHRMSRGEAESVLASRRSDVERMLAGPDPVPCEATSGDLRGVFVPVVAFQRPVGLIALFGRNRGSDLGDPELLQVIGTALGISLQNLQDKEELARTASLLGTTLESTADGILVVGKDGKIESFNQKFAEIWAMPGSVLDSKDDDQALSFVLDQLADPDAFLKKVRELYARPEAESHDTLLFKDGRVFERFSQPRRLNGQIVGRVWSFRDVTERLNAEQSLRESEQQFRAIQESALDAIITIDSDGDITSWNPQAETIFGWSTEEAMGRPLADTLIPAQHREQHTNGLLRFLRTGEGPVLNKRIEITAMRRDGHEFPVELAVVPLYRGERVSFCAFIRDLSEREKAEEKIRHLAYHDLLTGLPNRALFEEQLRIALAQARRSRQKVAVILLDLDRFKVVNDTIGHTGGDQFLQQLAGDFNETIREGDTVARIGGDEFMFLLPGIERVEDAAVAAGRILRRVREPRKVAGQEFRTTASLGVSVFPRDTTNPESLMRNADTAMYRAKERGRDNYQLFTPAMKASLQELIALEQDLSKALERSELFLLYQPVMEINSGVVVGGEALLRWQHPQRGLVMPDDFIPLAEETGLIVPIGEWVLRAACHQARLWHDSTLGPMRVTVNVSARQVEGDLARTVSEILAETGLPPACLHLELTEGAAMRNVHPVISTLSELRALGVGISVDDFGTGYSSLGYLKRFPIDTIKIDRSFVRDVITDHNDSAIVTTVIAMARSLNLRVIAEGVETEAQLHFLHENDCDEFQGFLLSRPVGPAQFEAVVTNARRHQAGRLSQIGGQRSEVGG